MSWDAAVASFILLCAVAMPSLQSIIIVIIVVIMHIVVMIRRGVHQGLLGAGAEPVD